MPVAEGDHRAATGTQDYLGTAAVNLVYVADHARMAKATEEDKTVSSAADTGFISQNVYLYCASEGLAKACRRAISQMTFLGSAGVAGLAMASNRGGRPPTLAPIDSSRTWG